MDSLNLSRDLQPIRAKSFINRLYLVLRNIEILFQKFMKKSKHTLSVHGYLCTSHHPEKNNLIGEVARLSVHS